MRRALSLLTIALAAAAGCSGDYADTYMAGATGGAGTASCPYISAGDKAYCIGTQDGRFPGLGWHIRGEMGGLWAADYKMADGFALAVAEDGADYTPLDKADTYTTLPYGNYFEYLKPASSLEISRFQYVPEGAEGMLVRYRLCNRSSSRRTVSLRFTTDFDLRPQWLSAAIGVRNGRDTLVLRQDFPAVEAWDINGGWSAVCIADLCDSVSVVQGRRCSGAIYSSIVLGAHQERDIWYCIAGDRSSGDKALEQCRSLLEERDRLLGNKKNVYRDLLSRSRINIPDKTLEEAYNWAKVNCRWLVATLPDGRQYMGAGAIDYPWLFGCDNSYTVQGLAATGSAQMAMRSLLTLMQESRRVNGNGRILHEMAPCGAVYNPGNTQEAAHFIVAAAQVYRWTGDRQWLSQLMPYMAQGLDWLLGEMDSDSNLLPEGYGIIEVQGLDGELIDSAVYTCQALSDMAWMAESLQDAELMPLCGKWRRLSALLEERIGSVYWSEERGLYSDTSDGVSSNHWVIATPMECGLASADRAIASLDKIRREHCGAYGPYISINDKRLLQMTIANGVHAVAEARYGRTDEALEYLDKIASTLGDALPGSICEVMPTEGCPAQAWTIYGLGRVIVEHIFGIQPDAPSRTVTIAPHLPDGWDDITIEDVTVGDMSFSLRVRRTPDGRIQTHIYHRRHAGGWRFVS